MSKFEELLKLNVNDKVEKKGQGRNALSYLSWTYAWAEFKKAYPDAKYRVLKDESGIPYFNSNEGAMCYTEVSANGETHEMWLPVMNGANKAMKDKPYTYKVKDYNTGKLIDKTVEPFTMFDVNKTIMRCLVKNLAMFGLGLYIYSGEDLPEQPVKELLPFNPDFSECQKAIKYVASQDDKEKAIADVEKKYKLSETDREKLRNQK